MKRLIATLVVASLLTGCGALRGRREATTPTIGQRIPVLSNENEAALDPALAAVPVTVPPPYVNSDWAQSGGNAAKSMIHVALAASPQRLWSVSIGEGSKARARLASEPVVGDGRIYTIDVNANVRAFDADTGRLIWSRQVRGENSPRETLFGGGVAFDSGRLYVVNGAGDAAALDAATGNQIWLKKPGGPLRGAPTIGTSDVYVLSQDNQLFALDLDTGETHWSATGSFELAGVFGAASPAYARSTVIAGYSSGELTAYRYENGETLWQDALARTGISTVVGTLSDVDADPVVDNGRVFAVGRGGRMVAIELITGQRAWEVNIAGLSTPWVAGDWVFVVTDRAEVMALARASGRVRWIAQLPAWRKPPRERPSRRYGERETVPGRDPIFWRGPVLAGGHLILTSSRGQIAFLNPADGSVARTIETGQPISLPPIVANNTLYVLDDNGRLTAYR
jgi:outer membrane protein assembly factor BamB